MKSLIRPFIFLSFIFLFIEIRVASAQDRYSVIESRLKELSKETLGLNEKVELSVNGISIQEFIRGLALSNNLNISVDPSLDVKIYNNFSNVTVLDVLMFLIKKYDLDVTFIGSIISFSQYAKPPFVPPAYIPKQIKISYNKADNLLSLDLSNDSLVLVAKEITKASQKNIVLSSDLNNKIVNGFIQDMPFDNALDKLAFANDLKITITNDNFYLVEKREPSQNKGSTSKPSLTGTNNPPGLGVRVEGGRVTVDASNAQIADVLAAVSSQLKTEYYLFSEIKGVATLNVVNATYEEFLAKLFNGTDFTFRKEGNIYLIGDRNLEGLRATEVVQMKYRTIEKIVDYIPTDLKKGIDVKVFPDLNSLILSGSQPRIKEVEAFLRDIDRIVPVIAIEVMIVDVRNTRTVSTGIEAGLKKQPSATGGTVFPGVDMTLGASSINNLITGANGFGLINLGRVTPNFYVTIRALEQQGLLKIRSTPRLATLNGHEAKMSIGRTEYYLEEQNNVIGSQNPQNIITRTYKSVNADLAVAINPIVSGDEQITLDIAVKQSNFTERISPSAPPGTITRDFQSLIRVKNEEMIILGGLEEDSKNDTGSGVPVLSRIPVLKWLFSSRTKTRSRTKLTIFIKATVIY